MCHQLEDTAELPTIALPSWKQWNEEVSDDEQF
jgi:hypothetical protein